MSNRHHIIYLSEEVGLSDSEIEHLAKTGDLIYESMYHKIKRAFSKFGHLNN